MQELNIGRLLLRLKSIIEALILLNNLTNYKRRLRLLKEEIFHGHGSNTGYFQQVSQ
ncbi:hypothetical protein PHYBLDRAFT_158159 [Phycomyces blakesleeanus NRRL 1555(-)]|uniref:Uncharacterized protein n=1 Tax=Phycomyces blakesleeanus (strain ATCC 8743b / DSM 1359 / FGSC 10004 / NBRC 33097 / NRRL 1555) TaxID=763407 RepID=A0A162PTK9_PHYB8|nr:hypothetical protein PHYBLDRAFT_158159 [Phycomyces blakesleeanus NRRL 1555(-)]OAD75867.1 hypothetical protein PHYBLDRAFT_158159 [Phycomyces blakesleeanus NRRL 1555(-)]|eukprot:XP_018293907.1 hypothetical protein PHYBLDRAFT_158159 [Phycomyces blakesleeanus NRRL 1555(-)]